MEFAQWVAVAERAGVSNLLDIVKIIPDLVLGHFLSLRARVFVVALFDAARPVMSSSSSALSSSSSFEPVLLESLRLRLHMPTETGE